MISLKTLLNEVLNTYIVTCDLISDSALNITEILNGVRALEKVIIVNNITPEDYPQKEKTEFTRITIKFMTRNNPKDDLVKFKDDMLQSSLDDKDPKKKIEGIKSVKFYEQTLKRV